MKVRYLAHQRFSKGSESHYKVRFLVDGSKSNDFETDDGQKAHIEYVGLNVQDLKVRPESFASLNGLRPLAEVDLSIEPMPQNPQRNWCTGVAQ